MSEIQDILTAFKAYAGSGVYEYADAAMTYGYRADRKLFYPAIEEYRAGLHQRMGCQEWNSTARPFLSAYSYMGMRPSCQMRSPPCTKGTAFMPK